MAQKRVPLYCEICMKVLYIFTIRNIFLLLFVQGKFYSLPVNFGVNERFDFVYFEKLFKECAVPKFFFVLRSFKWKQFVTLRKLFLSYQFVCMFKQHLECSQILLLRPSHMSNIYLSEIYFSQCFAESFFFSPQHLFRQPSSECAA